jgi:hypothetical protein
MDSSDFVKDGWQAGLWLVKTQTIGTAVDDIVVADAFSAKYDSYKIIISGGVASATANLYFQLGPSSIANYNNSYYYSTNGRTWANAADGIAAGNSSTFEYCGVATADDISYSVEVINPFLAKFTHISSTRIFSGTSGTATTGYCAHRRATSYSGFTLGTLSSAATLTGGTIRVYGYNN